MSAAAAHRLSRSRMDKSASFINRVLNLRSGELVRGLPLFGYYLLVITFYMMARVARDAIFLDSFNREQLPYADMSVAVVAAFILAPLHPDRLQGKPAQSANGQSLILRFESCCVLVGLSFPQMDMARCRHQFTTKVVAEKLNSPDANEVIYALTLFEMGQQLHAHSAIRKLLDHPSPHVRKKAISILNAAEDLSVKHQIVTMIRDNDLDVRAEALRYLSRHDDMDPLNYIDRLGEFADFSIRSATISFLMRPGEAQNLEAGRMILDGMIGDLENETLAVRAANSIALLGDMGIGALQDHLANPNEDLRIRKQIPEILFQIGTPRAAGALAENLVQAEAELRFKVISALNKPCEARGNLPVDRLLIESAMVAEMMGHYRSYQLLATANGEADERMEQSMREEL